MRLTPSWAGETMTYLNVLRGLLVWSSGLLVGLRFRSAVLMRNPVLLEQFLHLLGHEIGIVGDRNHRQLLLLLGLIFRRRR